MITSGFPEECLLSQWFDVEQAHSNLDIVKKNFHSKSYLFIYLFKGDITSLLCSLSKCLLSCIET